MLKSHQNVDYSAANDPITNKFFCNQTQVKLLLCNPLLFIWNFASVLLLFYYMINEIFLSLFNKLFHLVFLQ
jgi:hypothetical protein